MIKIGIQGIKGSFSEVAAIRFVEKHKINDYQLEYLINSENVLGALENNTTDIGIFAIENAIGGIVLESIYALAKYRCAIIDIFHIPISQSLLALPGISAERITEIHSHQQALRQCRDYLSKHFKGIPLIEESDTAYSAQRLRNGEISKTSAVISNKVCAQLYDLQLLREDIQDSKDNETLFLGVKSYESIHEK